MVGFGAAFSVGLRLLTLACTQAQSSIGCALTVSNDATRNVAGELARSCGRRRLLSQRRTAGTRGLSNEAYSFGLEKSRAWTGFAPSGEGFSILAEGRAITFARSASGRWARWAIAQSHGARGSRALLIGAAAVLFSTTPSLAQQDIGAAAVVLNKVEGTLEKGPVIIVQGDGVFRDEGVHTNIDSSAKLVLRDNTNISLGPNSSVKLDRFVYAGPAQTGTIAVNIAKGAFRFATGNAEKQAYMINTPTATLGVRGTVFHGNVTATETYLYVDEGVVPVCTRDPRSKKCQTLSNLNPQAIITATSVTITSGEDRTKDTLQQLCGGGDVCRTTDFNRFAMVNPGDLLSSHPTGGLALSTQVQDMLLSDPSLLGALLEAAQNGDSAQQAAIGEGLADAAQTLVTTNPRLAGTIQQQVALSGLSSVITAFSATSTGTQTASTGGDTGGGVGGPVGGNGSGSSGGGGGGSSGAGSSGTGNSGSGFGSSGSGGGAGGGASGSSTTSGLILPCTSSVSGANVCPPSP